MRGIHRVLFIAALLVLICGWQSTNAQATKQQNYFDDYPESWVEISSKGDTVIRGKDTKSNIRVKLSRYEKSIDKIKSSCECDNFAISIAVNDKPIIIPSTVYCEMNDLNRGQVFIDGKKYVLMLDGGDAAGAYYVKIEFDQDRVIRKSVYVSTSLSGASLFSETSYHRVRM